MSKEEAVLLFLVAPICVLLAGMTSNLFKSRHSAYLSSAKQRKIPLEKLLVKNFSIFPKKIVIIPATLHKFYKQLSVEHKCVNLLP